MWHLRNHFHSPAPVGQFWREQRQVINGDGHEKNGRGHSGDCCFVQQFTKDDSKSCTEIAVVMQWPFSERMRPSECEFDQNLISIVHIDDACDVTCKMDICESEIRSFVENCIIFFIFFPRFGRNGSKEFRMYGNCGGGRWIIGKWVQAL